MSGTYDITVTKDAWTELVAEGAYVAIQLNESGAIRVHVASVAPDDSSRTGIYVARNQAGVPGSFALGGLTSDAKIFVRSERDEQEPIVFLTY